MVKYQSQQEKFFEIPNLPISIEVKLTLPEKKQDDILPLQPQQRYTDLEFGLKLWIYYHPKGMCKGMCTLDVINFFTCDQI